MCLEESSCNPHCQHCHRMFRLDKSIESKAREDQGASETSEYPQTLPQNLPAEKPTTRHPGSRVSTCHKDRISCLCVRRPEHRSAQFDTERCWVTKSAGSRIGCTENDPAASPVIGEALIGDSTALRLVEGYNTSGRNVGVAAAIRAHAFPSPCTQGSANESTQASTLSTLIEGRLGRAAPCVHWRTPSQVCVVAPGLVTLSRRARGQPGRVQRATNMVPRS